jgi:photosystem II stability/assembly factor-like uncharacterized protein
MFAKMNRRAASRTVSRIATPRTTQQAPFSTSVADEESGARPAFLECIEECGASCGVFTSRESGIKKRLLFALGLVALAGLLSGGTASAGVNTWTLDVLGSETINTIGMFDDFPQYLYIGTDDGEFTAEGTTTTHNMPGLPVYSIAVAQSSPYGYYAATQNGLLKSTDGFDSFGYSETGMPSGAATLVVIDPANSSVLYAVKDAVYKSTNAGVSWSPADTGLTSGLPNSIVVSPTDSSVLYAGTAGGIFKSVNGGGSWTLLSSAVSDINVLVIDPLTPATIYAGMDYYGVSKSIDGGATWTPSSDGISACSITCFVNTLAIDPFTPSTLYASERLSPAVYKSVNGGDSWTDLHTADLGGHATQTFLIYPMADRSSDIFAGTSGGVYSIKQSPGAFTKGAPNGGDYVHLDPMLTWGASSGSNAYQYCYDTTNDDACDGGWTWTGAGRSADLSGLSNNTTYYWQVRANNYNGTTYANDGNWRSFTARNQTFADVPIDHSLWQYIEAFYSSGITGGCGTSPLIFCPNNNVTRAAMAVFLLRAKHGAGYAPPAAGHYFADLPVAGKEWQEAWVDQFYREGITGGCATSPLAFCPEQPVTRAAMAVFILRAKYGASYTPPAASHYFADMPVAGKEWMEPWVDQLYREGITTGCGTGPLIYCPETAVKRQAMAAFIVRAFNLPLP